MDSTHTTRYRGEHSFPHFRQKYSPEVKPLTLSRDLTTTFSGMIKEKLRKGMPDVTDEAN